MKTAVIGFPRIGALRELKFSSEKYFRNEITEEELLETGRTLRKTESEPVTEGYRRNQQKTVVIFEYS